MTRIERARGFLDAAKLSPEWIAGMQRRALVLEAHHSTHIEGTTLTLDQSDKLLSGGRPRGVRADDAKEVINYRDAFDLVASYLDSGEPITEGLIREIHKRLVRNVRGNEARPGEYRIVQNYVANSVTREVIYTPPAPIDVHHLMTELVAWLNSAGEVHPILCAGIAQFQLVHIHPFLDGNGRTARLLAMLCMYRSGYDFRRLFTLSEYYDRDRTSYYRAIQSVRERRMDLTNWLSYFAAGLEWQLVEVQAKGERIIREQTLSERQRAALELARAQPSFRIDELAACCPGVHRRTLQRDLRGLIEMGLIKADGATNRLVYSLVESA